MTSSYTYDGTGLRQSKTVNGVTTNHIWDGTNIVAESNGAYILKRYYRGANGLIYANLAGTETKYLKDGHGNITGLANMSGTTLSKSYTYDAFGVEKDIDTTDKNPFRYCGEYYDNEIDKIYLRARYYSPIQGRFITEDPIKDGLNWYAYCAGDPVNAWDPSGLFEYGDQYLEPENVAQIMLYTIMYHGGRFLKDDNICKQASTGADKIRENDTSSSFHAGLDYLYSLDEDALGYEIQQGMFIGLKYLQERNDVFTSEAVSSSVSDFFGDIVGTLLYDLTDSLDLEENPCTEYFDFINTLGLFYNNSREGGFITMKVIAEGEHGYLSVRFIDQYNNVEIEERFFEETYKLTIQNAGHI